MSLSSGYNEMAFDAAYNDEYDIMPDPIPEKVVKMKSIKDVAKYYISERNYKKDTRNLTEEVYREFGIDLSRIDGITLLYGSSEVPKLISVVRRVQMVKKAVAARVQRAINRQMEEEAL